MWMSLFQLQRNMKKSQLQNYCIMIFLVNAFSIFGGINFVLD